MADVTNRVDLWESPNVQLVGLVTGNKISRSTFPSGVMRISRDPPKRAFHKHPSASIADPSGTRSC